MKEGTVSVWSKQEGDRVKKGDPIADINSEKLEKEIEAPVDGTIIKISVPEGHGVPPGEVICYIGEPGEQIEDETVAQASKKEIASTTEAVPQSKKTSVKTRIKISPVAKKIAENQGIDVTTIKGTGPQGRITKEDIERAIESKPVEETVPEVNQQIEDMVEKVPVAGMRKVIADRMQASLQNAAQLTINMKADVTSLLTIQKQLSEVAQNEHDTKLTVTDFISRAVVLALREHKQLNSKRIKDEIHLYQSIHLGMAVALDKGLVVPVIRNAQTLTLLELAKKVKELAARSREGSLTTDEMSGSTFTITNLGALGVEHFTPILNTGESGILGVGAVEEVAKFIGDDVEKRQIVPLSLTFDHQVLDGTPAAEFLRSITRYLEEPTRMLL